MRIVVIVAVLVPMLAACSSNPSSAPRDVYYWGNDYWHVPPGYRAVCENRQMMVTTPEGEELRGAEGVEALNSASKRVEPDEAGAVTDKRVFGVSRTRCQNGYGRWGYPPRAHGPEDPRNECDRLAQPGSDITGSVTGTAGVSSPGVDCPP